MNPYILPLADPRADLLTVGGKGMSLAKLANAGLAVPGGFHITTAAYRHFVQHNNLQPGIIEALQTIDTSRPATLETASTTISQLFAQAEVPTDLAKAIADAYAALPSLNTAVAVRSSATAEDLPEASFAGQQETYLNISGAGQLLQATQKCWASLWTARAIGYRAHQNIMAEGVALAVVVQEMVQADAAGILFTANPLNGKRDEVVINAAWGLGEAVVGGAVTPDTIVVNKVNGVLAQRETADKLVMTVRTENGTEEQATPPQLRQKAVLTDEQAVELMNYGVEIERLYGLPMDIEWTLAQGQFAIVQARPITALPEEVAHIPTEWHLPDPKAHYARGSLAEHTPSPVSPLFATLGLRLANEATNRLWRDFMDVDPTIMFVGDSFYMPINSYIYGGFRFSWKAIWIMLKVSFTQLGSMMRGTVARWQEAHEVLVDTVAVWEKEEIATFSPAELLESVRTVFAAAVKYYTVIQSTLPAASMSEVFFSRFYNGFVKRKSDPEFTALLFGFETMPMRAEKSLFDIATWLKEQPVLAAYTLQTATETLIADYKRETPPTGIPIELWVQWQAQLHEHFDTFGRTAYEFDFINPTPAEAPSPQFEAIKLFLEGKAASPYVRQETAVTQREQATQAILSRIGWPRKKWFTKLLRWAQETGAIREDSIADMGTGHPLIRRLFAELGNRFVAGGAIKDADDIYWLEEHEVEELVTALEKEQSLPSFVQNIPIRKAEWRAALQLTPPVALPQKSFILKLIGGSEAKEKDGKLVLKGLGTGTGQVKAPACVLHGPEDFPKMKPGDVLVATTTTPAWTPLFAMAAAVVTDIGGPLSHSSIVAREYGIPAVMAARNATRHIHSGQMIVVDGTAGTVTLESNGIAQ